MISTPGSKSHLFLSSQQQRIFGIAGKIGNMALENVSNWEIWSRRLPKDYQRWPHNDKMMNFIIFLSQNCLEQYCDRLFQIRQCRRLTNGMFVLWVNGKLKMIYTFWMWAVGNGLMHCLIIFFYFYGWIEFGTWYSSRLYLFGIRNANFLSYSKFDFLTADRWDTTETKWD